MKKIGKICVLVCIVALCACVFPIGLIRKNATIYSTLGINYSNTIPGREVSQTFIAQTEYLEEIAFDIVFPDGKSETGSFNFQLREESGKKKVIIEKTIPIQEVNNDFFTYVSIGKWIKKGEPYTFTISCDETTHNYFQVVYTVDAEHAAPGNIALSLDSEIIEGQAVTGYTYGFRLNIKNVICIWAFILLIGLIVLELLCDDGLWQKNKWLVKSEDLLTKWQLPLLMIEFGIVILMLIRISRNEAVHWDEAYTWQMVTQNNLGEMLSATAADVHPPLYYALVMGVMKIFGQNIFAAKMVSIAGTAATGILGMTLVRKRWGIKVAMPFIMVAGFAPQLVYYSLDLRMYSWVCFFVIAAGVFAYEILQSGKVGWWIGFTLMALGGVYTQYFAVVPLVVIYAYLFIEIVLNDKKQIKKWIMCCVATIIGYLPWLSVVIETLKRDSMGSAGADIVWNFHKICKWAFKSNITLSEYMPAVLFFVIMICLLIERKKYLTKEWKFVAFTGIMFFAALGLCAFLTSHMKHFWDNRYITDVLLFVWIFMLIVLSRRSLVTWFTGMIWLGILMLSSYTVMQATELNTIPWTQNTRQVLQQVQSEEQIVYTFPTYDVLYKYYVPNAEFIWYEDVDFNTWDKEEFYVISWGESDFPYMLYSEGILKKEIVGSMRMEEGITAELWKMRKIK